VYTQPLEVVRSDLDGLHPGALVPVEQRLVAGPLGRVRFAVHQDAVLQAGQFPGDPVGRPDEIRFGDDHPRLGVAQNVRPFLLGQAVVQREEDRPDTVRRIDQFQELRPVVQQQSDDVTAPDAQLRQARGQPVDPVVEFAHRQAPLVLGDGHGFGPLGQVVIEDAREIVHAVSLALCRHGECFVPPLIRKGGFRPIGCPLP
jgi:hypothetical protein